jgi:hypothetical protein
MTSDDILKCFTDAGLDSKLVTLYEPYYSKDYLKGSPVRRYEIGYSDVMICIFDIPCSDEQEPVRFDSFLKEQIRNAIEDIKDALNGEYDWMMKKGDSKKMKSG